MVVSYEFDRVVKMCVFIRSSVIFLVVLINFLRKAIGLIKYWVTISSGDGREVVNFCGTLELPSFVAALSSRSLSDSHISTELSISSMSGWRSSQHPRCINAIALLAWSCRSSCRVRRATQLPEGRSSTPVTGL